MLANWSKEQRQAVYFQVLEQTKFPTQASPSLGRARRRRLGKGPIQEPGPAFRSSLLRATRKEARITPAEALAADPQHPENSPGPRLCPRAVSRRLASSGLTWGKGGRRGLGRLLTPPQRLPAALSPGFQPRTLPQLPLPSRGLGRRLRGCLHRGAPHAAAAAAAAFSPP